MADPLESDSFGRNPLFFSRRRPTDAEIEEIIERFVDETLSMAEAEAAFERLARVKKQVLSRLLDLAASPNPLLHHTAATLMGEMELTRAIRPLRQLLENPNLDDEHKMSILHALQNLGGLSPDENPFNFLRDPDAMFRKSQEAVLNSLQDPLQLEMVLRTIVDGNLPIQQHPAALSAMAQSQDRRVLPLLLCLLHAPDDEVVIGAIEALEILRDPATMRILEERSEYDPSSEVRQVAKDAATHLAIETIDSSLPPSILDLPIAPPPLVRCLISTIDGSGGQILVIIRQDPDSEGTFLFWDLMFNDHEGIKDCFGGHSSDDTEIEDIIVDGMAELGIEMVEISLEKARVEIEQAQQVTLNAGRRLPPSFPAWQTWLQGEDPLSVEFSSLPKLSADERTAFLERCYELVDLDEFESWLFNPDELGGLEHSFGHLVDQEGTDDAIDALVSRGIGEVVDEQRRRLLRVRLQRQAWLLAQVYEEDQIPKLALAAAFGLSDDAPLPLEEHPLLREMMFHSLFNASFWVEERE